MVNQFHYTDDQKGVAIKMKSLNVLVLSHFYEGNRIFEDYCSGIKAQCGNYTYVDYIERYLTLGKVKFEKEIETLVIDQKIDCLFFIWWSSDLTFDLKFIEKLSSLTTIIINYFDTEYYFEGVDRYYAQLADLIFAYLMKENIIKKKKVL